MKAKVIPWSSVVGTGVVLLNDKGQAIGQLALHNVAMLPSDNTKDKHLSMAHDIANAINEASQPTIAATLAKQS